MYWLKRVGVDHECIVVFIHCILSIRSLFFKIENRLLSLKLGFMLTNHLGVVFITSAMYHISKGVLPFTLMYSDEKSKNTLYFKVSLHYHDDT